MSNKYFENDYCNQTGIGFYTHNGVEFEMLSDEEYSLDPETFDATFEL